MDEAGSALAEKRSLAWPYSIEVPSFLFPEQDFRSPDYLLVSPPFDRIIQDFLKRADRENLTDMVAPFPQFDPIMRYPELDEMVVRVGEEIMTGAQVAAYNLREITKASMVRWRMAVSQLFRASGLREIRRHRADHLVVAIVGCEGGYGIREIFQVFSQVGIPTELYAVDERSLPPAEEYKDFYGQMEVSLVLNSKDPRKIVWSQVKPDVVVLPRFWMAGLPSYDAWKETIAQIAEAKPSIMIAGFPRGNSIVEDPAILEDVARMTAEMMYQRQQISTLPQEGELSVMGLQAPEISILGGLFSYYGYERRAIEVFTDKLVVPCTIYGAALVDSRDERESLVPLDPYFLLATHKDLVGK
jgi:hypothetical protein